MWLFPKICPQNLLTLVLGKNNFFRVNFIYFEVWLLNFFRLLTQKPDYVWVNSNAFISIKVPLNMFEIPPSFFSWDSLNCWGEFWLGTYFLWPQKIKIFWAGGLYCTFIIIDSGENSSKNSIIETDSLIGKKIMSNLNFFLSWVL